eukprot:gnl/MRDRNA2_/MRDRNA2_158778_c0_seq1.p1 gnl/MRDRNA2_/MRDRNA2_158778_c0~~gnl/MRDRNA2_/MRDRNA2_158778_c0_seq1.p1  ORF type:complete len:209 (-),score=26.98 gnl/MRDRNA2_/MRDRNA2_158778_c0_seq1:620-1246(-)
MSLPFHIVGEQKACVRNTFLELHEERPVLRRVHSDSEISSHTRSHSSQSSWYTGDPQTFGSTSSVNVGAEDENREGILEACSGNPADLPSAGSAVHFDGQCRPCCYFQRKKCIVGKDCEYCHLPHDRKQRAGKKSRERARRRQQRVTESSDTQSTDELTQDHISSSRDSPMESDAGWHELQSRGVEGPMSSTSNFNLKKSSQKKLISL